jgi:hypothetical protein
MRDVAEWTAGLIDRLRHTSPEMGLVRIALLVVSLMAVVMIRSWTGEDVAGVLLWLAAGLVAATMFRPDSFAPGALLATLGVWWLGSSSGAEPWQHVTIVVCFAGIHILAAHAGAAPSHASFTPGASFTMVVGAGAYVVVVGLAALLLIAAMTAGGGWASVPLAITAGFLLLAAIIAGVLVASRQ